MNLRRSCQLRKASAVLSFVPCLVMATAAQAGSLKDGTNYLSDVDWSSARSGLGPVERDQSNGGRAAGDGTPLELDGIRYDKGLGVHSNSEVIYSLGGRCQTLSAVLGINDRAGNKPIQRGGSVVFRIVLDDSIAYESPVIRAQTPAQPLTLDISGTEQLRLVTWRTKDGAKRDHADWADLRVVCRNTSQAATRPAVFFTDVVAGAVQGGPGENGVPITIFGHGFGATRGTSKVTIGGVEVARYLSWNEAVAANSSLETIVVQPGPTALDGPVVVTTPDGSSNDDQTFTVTNGKIYFVAPSGSDQNDCSETAPCATILHVADDVMRAGDSLLVRGGPINDDEIWIRDILGHSGAPGRPKNIVNYPGERPYFTKANRPVILDANLITFAGIEFRDGKSLGLGSEQNFGNRVVNCKFGGAIAWDAIGSHGNDHLIAGNDCRVASSSVGTQGHCYYISHGRGVQLRYNVARGAPGYGIHIFDQRRAANDIVRVIADLLVEGNLLASSPERSGLVVAMGDEDGRGNHIERITIRNNVFFANNFAGIAIGDNTRDVRIYHNTFYQNGRQGITIYDTPSIDQVEIINNLFDQTSNGHCRNNCSWYEEAHVQIGARARRVSLAHNFYAMVAPKILGGSDATGISGDPKFVAPEGENWHLGSDSAAIDSGMTLPAVPRDLDGVERPQGARPEAGAFERR